MPMKPETMSTFQNHLLVATPNLSGSDWQNAGIYMCSHTEEGAMGVIINQPMDDVSFNEIAESMDVDLAPRVDEPIIFAGGPVEDNRGFVLHSEGYEHESTMDIGPHIKLSATADIVTAIAQGLGPRDLNFCLGYAGWSPGQLEQEIADNSWLVLPADLDVIFHIPAAQRYTSCLSKLGLDLGRMPASHGHA